MNDNDVKSNFLEETKDTSFKSLSKIDHELYKEEDDVALPLIRVKRVILPNKGSRWKIFNDNKVVFIIEGSKLLNKEQEYLQSIEGFNFILTQAKAGIKSFHSFHQELKKKTVKPHKKIDNKLPIKKKVKKVVKPRKRGPGRPKKVR